MIKVNANADPHIIITIVIKVQIELDWKLYKLKSHNNMLFLPCCGNKHIKIQLSKYRYEHMGTTPSKSQNHKVGYK